MKLICVIGDVVQSRNIAERTAFQRRLQKALDTLNSRRKKELISPCTITLGDEFQAVYRDANTLFNDFWFLRTTLYPVNLRFAIGIGNLSTAINRKMAIGMDGPAFHAAREGMIDLKGSGNHFRLTDSAMEMPPWINMTLDLISHASDDWKANRHAIFEKLLNDKEPKVIAEEVALTNAAIYKNIQSGSLGTVKSMLREISSWINSRLEDK